MNDSNNITSFLTKNVEDYSIKHLSSKDIIAKFTKMLELKFAKDLEKIILFGSRAKDMSYPDSDYDFLIVINKKSKGLTDAIYDIVMDFLLDYGADISLKIYTKERFDHGMSCLTPFMQEVDRTGIVLWKKKK